MCWKAQGVWIHENGKSLPQDKVLSTVDDKYFPVIGLLPVMIVGLEMDGILIH